MTDDYMIADATSRAQAVFSDAFQFPGAALDPSAPAVIERDRLIMAARPGMLRKLLPVRVDASGVYCGGCYLFDTYDNAAAYADWVANEFVLDGKLFLNRPEFLEPTSQLWQVAGAADFADVASDQELMRFERWRMPKRASLARLRDESWPLIRKAAEQDGAASVWLLYDDDEFHPGLGLVTARRRPDVANRGATPPDVAELERRDSLGAALAQQLRGTKVFDRTSWIYMIWHPIDDGDDSPHAAQWPCSPPLPSLVEPRAGR